ncbi:MAG: TMEM175 family protein [Acidobacteriaceae bacterium]
MAEEPTGSARLEAFSDGVIAVVITIMVLEIKVPRANGLQGLRDLVPSLVVYLLSFWFTGVYWLNHQHLLRRARKAGHAIQCANLGFLFCLSLLPLSTAYVVVKHLSGFAVAVYSALLFIIAISFLWLRLAVHRHLQRRADLSDEDRQGLRNHLFGIFFYAAGIPVAFFYPRPVLVAIALLTLIWILPNLSLQQARRLSD